jgi:transaldolase
MPRATLEAFADHGVVRANAVAGTYDQARAHFAALARLGIDYQKLIDVLETEGLTKFETSWEELGDAVSRQLHEAAQKD